MYTRPWRPRPASPGKDIRVPSGAYFSTRRKESEEPPVGGPEFGDPAALGWGVCEDGRAYDRNVRSARPPSCARCGAEVHACVTPPSRED